MKIRWQWMRVVVWGLALSCAASCALETDQGPPDANMTRAALRDLDERATEVLWQEYLRQGISPCDPPPDPWHPFVTYGYCSAGAVNHEAVPGTSFDEP